MTQTKTSRHAESSLRLLDEADRRLDGEDLYKACEKGLEAVHGYLRTIAKERGWAHESQRDLYDISLDLSFETDDPKDASSLHMAIEGGLGDKVLRLAPHILAGRGRLEGR